LKNVVENLENLRGNIQAFEDITYNKRRERLPNYNFIVSLDSYGREKISWRVKY
jgi:hypothetical protein